MADCKVFDEADGTEIDDDECLSAYEKGSIFILGSQWKPVISESGGESSLSGFESWQGDINKLAGTSTPVKDIVGPEEDFENLGTSIPVQYILDSCADKDVETDVSSQMLVDDQYMPMDAVTIRRKMRKKPDEAILDGRNSNNRYKKKIYAGKIISSTIEEYWWIALKRTKVILGPDKLN